MPGGATGGVWQSQELHALHQLANRVRVATEEGTTRLPFTLDIAPRWPDTAGVALFGAHDDRSPATPRTPLQLHGTLNLLTPQGQVIYRYDAPRARDYLSAWLAHLAYCAALPDGPRRTRVARSRRAIVEFRADAGRRSRNASRDARRALSRGTPHAAALLPEERVAQDDRRRFEGRRRVAVGAQRAANRTMPRCASRFAARN